MTDDAQRMLAESDVVHSAEAVQAALARLAAEIEARLAGRFPLVLGVMGGAVVFAGQVLPRLGFPLEFAAIEATRYGPRLSGADIDWRLAPREHVRGRTVLVLDDILDEGITLRAIVDRVRAMGAAEVRVAVLAEKDTGRPKPVAADFVGLRVPNRFVFGFGMDARGLWRNLPAIHALRES